MARKPCKNLKILLLLHQVSLPCDMLHWHRHTAHIRCEDKEARFSTLTCLDVWTMSSDQAWPIADPYLHLFVFWTIESKMWYVIRHCNVICDCWSTNTIWRATRIFWHSMFQHECSGHLFANIWDVVSRNNATEAKQVMDECVHRLCSAWKRMQMMLQKSSQCYATRKVIC